MNRTGLTSARPKSRYARSLRVQQLVLHGELADTAHGGVVNFSAIEAPSSGQHLGYRTDALLEACAKAGQGLVILHLEATDLDAELAGERVERLTAQEPPRHLTL